MSKIKFLARFGCFALVLALLMTTAACGASGGDAGGAATQNRNTEPAAATGDGGATEPASDGDAATEPAGEKETIKLQIGGYALDRNSADDPFYPSPVIEEIQRRTGVEMEFLFMDLEQMRVLMAGGDLPDIVNTDQTFIKPMVEGGHAVELDPYLEQYGPNILKNYPTRLEFSRKFLSNDTGRVYVLPAHAGPDNISWTPNGGYIVRMDYYKELGSPAITSWDEYLDVLAAMQKAHPETEDGKKVYGIGIYNDWGSTWGWWGTTGFAEGFYNAGHQAYGWHTSKNELISFYTDLDGPLWRTLDYMFKANQLGLMDPDSFTMKYSDWEAKVKSDQYLSATLRWALDTQYKTKLAENPDYQGGFMILPSEGMAVWHGMGTQVGQTNKLNMITTNCENVERAVELIDFWYSDEGARLNYSGIEGEDWTVVDGVPTPTQSAIDLYMQGGDAYRQRFGGVHSNLMGSSGNKESSVDGALLSLFADPSLEKTLYTPVDKEFCEVYGVETRGEAYKKLVDDGKMYDFTTSLNDIANAIPQPPDDIRRLDVKLEEIMVKGLPKVVLAADRAEFEANRQQVLDDLTAGGVDESITWWQAEWDKAKAFIESTQ